AMLIAVIVALVLAMALLFRGMALLAWLAATASLLVGWRLAGVANPAVFITVVSVLVLVTLAFGVPAIRRVLLGGLLMKVMGKALPRLGDTERVALEAGTVWWDRDLFSGRPDWNKLMKLELPALPEREQAFLDGPVEQLCRMIDDWQVQQDRDL